MTNATTRTVTGVAGVDLFVEARLGEELPRTVGPFSLKHVASRGTVTNAASAGTILDVGWVCARYLVADKAIPAAQFDAAVGDLVTEIGRTRRWSSLVKLFEIEGEKAYS